MRTIDEWLAACGESHHHPVHKLIHRLAVPVIVLDVLGLLRVVPTTAVAAWLPPFSWVLIAGALAFYARLSTALALGMLLLTLPSMAVLDAGLAALGAWSVSVLVGVLAITWAAQFVGHALEGKKPSFFEDLQFLLIGPLWLLADAYDRLGLRLAPPAPSTS